VSGRRLRSETGRRCPATLAQEPADRVRGARSNLPQAGEIGSLLNPRPEPPYDLRVGIPLRQLIRERVDIDHGVELVPVREFVAVRDLLPQLGQILEQLAVLDIDDVAVAEG
jgi:hypothetical protein